MKIKVIGAGSIGNHLAHAARTLGWDVTICDIDDEALDRTRNNIYPTRYGNWDDQIKLYNINKLPNERYDMVFIGTPPDSHLEIAISSIKESPELILIEKPACPPSLSHANELIQLAKENNVQILVGYDHVVATASDLLHNIVISNDMGNIETLDVEFREHWAGIFAAHPWLDGPWDTYLGFWERGGGAASEHSNATNLWQYFARILGAGKIIEVSARLEYVRDKKINYDKLAMITVRCESGLVGRIVQDVVTKPARKWARIQGDKGYIKWECGFESGKDSVEAAFDNGAKFYEIIEKTRPDDFIKELQHIEKVYKKNIKDSPLSINYGLDTMLVIAAAHMSSKYDRTVAIDYNKGYSNEALSLK